MNKRSVDIVYFTHAKEKKYALTKCSVHVGIFIIYNILCVTRVYGRRKDF